MAVQTGSVTMAQAAALSNEPLVQTVTMSLVDMGSVLARDIPFLEKPTLYVNGVRFEGGLPAVTWAALNQEGVTVSTAPSPFLEQLDQLLFSVDAPDGSPSVTLYCNEVFRRRMNHAVRLMGTQGGFNQARDMYDRVVDTYKSCIIRDIGRKRDQVSLIITITELATGLADTGGTFTSVYAVNYADGHFGGWQFNPLAAGVQNLGRLNTGVQYRTYVSWAGGFINYSTRSIARLYNIKMS